MNEKHIYEIWLLIFFAPCAMCICVWMSDTSVTCFFFPFLFCLYKWVDDFPYRWMHAMCTHSIFTGGHSLLTANSTVVRAYVYVGIGIDSFWRLPIWAMAFMRHVKHRYSVGYCRLSFCWYEYNEIHHEHINTYKIISKLMRATTKSQLSNMWGGW